MDATLQQRVAIRLWGDFRLLDGAGAPIEITSKKARACLALLATAPEATVSRDRLAAMLWGDRTDGQARANLRQMLYELKPLAQAPAPIFGFDRHDVWFDSACELDTDALLRHGAAELATSLPGRGEVYLGDLDGVSAEFDDWLAPERASAEAALKRIVQLRAEESFARGDFPAVRTLTEAWAARDATDETVAQFGLRADAALGDGASIAQRMNRLEAALATELGVRPSAATVALARELSMQMGVSPGQVLRPTPAQSLLPSAAPPHSRRGARHWHFAAAAAVIVVGLVFAGWQIIENRFAPSAGSVEAERLTTNARELSRGRTRAGYSQAAALARRAIASDPNFAPAWAELALASWLPAWWEENKHPGSLAKARADALGYLDRALELKPNLGRALAVRGMIIGEKAATPLLERAVIEAPDDGEAWLWLGNQRAESGSLGEAMGAYRRAAELEPLWERSVGAYVLTAARLGEDAAADRALDRFAAAAPNRFAVESLRASIARERGDLLSAAKHGSLALSLAPDDPWIQMIELALVARAAGDIEAIRRLTSTHAGLRARLAPVLEPQGAVTRAEGTAAAWWNSVLVEEEARLLLRAGRPGLLLALVASQPLYLLDLHSGRNSNGAFGAQLILALRSSGRESEATEVVDAIHKDLSRRVARQQSYFDLDLASAASFALDGRDDEAVAALDRAFAKGWRGQRSEWAVDPGDEPAFAHLRGREDFERVRAHLAAEIERVRPQISEILAQTAIPVDKTAIADDL